jgi:hypothetical protein
MFKPEAPATRADLAYTSQQLYKNLNARLEALETKTGISKSSSSASSVSQPEYKLVESRNAIRRSDVWSIINAIYQYSIDSNKHQHLRGKRHIKDIVEKTCQMTASVIQ